jgi:hypothetical protein
MDLCTLACPVTIHVATEAGGVSQSRCPHCFSAGLSYADGLSTEMHTSASCAAAAKKLISVCCRHALLLVLVFALQHNTLPVIFKPELPAKIGLLPLTAKSGDEVSRALTAVSQTLGFSRVRAVGGGLMRLHTQEPFKLWVSGTHQHITLTNTVTVHASAVRLAPQVCNLCASSLPGA